MSLSKLLKFLLSTAFLFCFCSAFCGVAASQTLEESTAVSSTVSPELPSTPISQSRLSVSPDDTLQIVESDDFKAKLPPLPTKPQPKPNTQHIRQIPDLRVLFQPGVTKPTDIDLLLPYQMLDIFDGATPIMSIEDAGNPDIAEVEIRSGELFVTWKNFGKSQIILKIVHPITGQIFFDRVSLEAWKPSYIEMFFYVLGGLGIFLLGMRNLSEGLQMAAGPSLRLLIATVTDNRFAAVLVGLVVTGVIQSSSVTTVMVVGFVNSQIMTLTQGIGVIMGANIGTTFTGWILTLEMGKYGLPMLGVAGMVYMFAKVERTRLIAMAVMGLGFVFFGLELMQTGFKPLREIQGFYEWMQTFSADSYGGVLLCAAVGCVLTLIVQSSSATIGITISLAAIDVIRFDTAAALVLGENVGTTITAILASIGSSTNARRAAYFHVVFNMLGVFWVTLIFRDFFLPMVIRLVGTNALGEISDPKVGIALAHSLFNMANVIVFLPFTKLAATLLVRFVPDSNNPAEEQPRLTSLGIRHLETPAIAIELSRVEVLRMGNECIQLTKTVRQILDSPESDQTLIDSAFHQEEMLDSLQDEIIEFTSSLLSGNISLDIGEAAHQQLRMADELESISDYLIVVLKSDLKMRKDGLSIPEPQKTDFRELCALLADYLELVVRFYSARKTTFGDLMTEIHAQGRSFTRKVKTIRDLFVKRMMNEKCDPQVVIAFNTQINAFRRVREHTQNVAEAIVGAK